MQSPTFWHIIHNICKSNFLLEINRIGHRDINSNRSILLSFEKYFDINFVELWNSVKLTFGAMKLSNNDENF